MRRVSSKELSPSLRSSTCEYSTSEASFRVQPVVPGVDTMPFLKVRSLAIRMMAWKERYRQLKVVAGAIGLATLKMVDRF
jgi:hypothetical protein